MFRPSPLALAIAVSLAPVSVPAFANDTDGENNATVMEAITVTGTRGATKTETPFVETPQAVSIIPEEQIEEQGSESVQEATRYSAGVFTNQYGATGSRYDAIKLRGFGSDSIDNQYLDGLKLLNDKGTYSILQIDPYFLERIEVVKGPSSVLYGRAAPGGLVALTSKKPVFEPQYQVQASVGTQNHKGVAFDFSNQLGDSGRAAYRLIGLAQDADSQWDKVEQERYALAPSLTLDLGQATTLTLMAYLQRDPEGGYYGGVPAEGSLTPRNGRRISNSFYDGEPDYERFDRRQTLLGYQLEHRFDSVWSARQNLRFHQSDVEYGQVYNSGFWLPDDTLPRSYFGADEDLEGLAVDNQLIAEFGTGAVRHTLLMGLDYQQLDVDADWTWGGWPSTFAPIDPFDPVYGTEGVITPYQNNERSLEQTGVYLQDQLAYGNWRLTLGGRYDWIDVDNEFDTVAFGTGGEEGLDDQHFSGRVGLLHLFDNGVAPYLSYSESFNPNSNVDENGDLIRPNEGEQIEAGLKYQPPGTRNRYSLAVFRIDQDNVANYIQQIQAYRATGSVRSEGVELEMDTALTENLSVLASYTYTDVTVEESAAGNEGETPVATPRHLAALWASYRFLDGVVAGLDLAGGVRYVGDSWANDSNTLEVPDYTLVDLSIGYDLGQVGLAGVSTRLNANNLLDKEYVAACISEFRCYYGAERSVQATVTYDF